MGESLAYKLYSKGKRIASYDERSVYRCVYVCVCWFMGVIHGCVCVCAAMQIK